MRAKKYKVKPSGSMEDLEVGRIYVHQYQDDDRGGWFDTEAEAKEAAAAKMIALSEELKKQAWWLRHGDRSARSR